MIAEKKSAVEEKLDSAGLTPSDADLTGVAAFALLSADALQRWWEAVVELIDDPDGEGVSSRTLREKLEAFVDGESVGDLSHLSVGELEELLGTLAEDDEGSEESGGGLGSALFSGVLGLGRVLLPAPVKAVLGLGSTLWSVFKGLVWGLVLFGGFQLVRRRGSKVVLTPDGDESVEMEWDYELVRSPEGTARVVTSHGRSVRVMSGELEGSEALYERLTGTKAVGGALSSGYYRSNGDVHGGWDLRTPDKTPLRWPFKEAGTVVRVNETLSGGKQIFVRTGAHEWGFAHLSDNTVVPEGTVLQEGDVFAVSGHSGYAKNGSSYAPHVHINATRVEDVGKPYNTDTERRLLHANMVDALQTEGVPVTSASGAAGGSSDSMPPVVGSVSGDSGTRLGSPVAQRTNNPYSVMALSGGDKWEGQVGTERLPSGHRIVKFDSPRSASRAASLTLLRYQQNEDLSGTGGVSIRLEDVARYYVNGERRGPLSGDARRWARTLEGRLGLERGGSVDLRDPEQLDSVLSAIAHAESNSEVSQQEQRGGIYSAYNYRRDRGYNDQGSIIMAPNVQR